MKTIITTSETYSGQWFKGDMIVKFTNRCHPPNSFGFRTGRSCHDAIQAIYQNICHKPKWILETDISKCFDKIAHQPLLKKLRTSPFIARQIRAWLKAGVVDGFNYHQTASGVPQGGSLSPLLANIALHGMENRISKRFRGAKLIRYADDLVVIHDSLEIIQQIQPYLPAILILKIPREK